VHVLSLKNKHKWEKIMKLSNINGFATIDKYVEDKIKRYGAEEKNFQTLFSYMFAEKQNIITESADGYRIQKVTYGECEAKIKTIAFVLSKRLQDVPQGAIVGLYMGNSLAWIQIFWSILSCGYRPLLLNSRLPKSVLEQTLGDYNVAAVLSDGETFSVSTHSVATIFAWTGALRKRGELDGISELCSFADKLEKATLSTIESGKMTKDLALITSMKDVTVLNSENFIKAIRETLETM
jgi:long-subunit acyl-CoA synthetase (AMP-forming)